MKLIIERSKWLHGEGSEESRLLRSEDGKMCCLGFFALSCNLTPDHISDEPTPNEVGIRMWDQNVADWLWDDASGLEAASYLSSDCQALMDINDSVIITEDDREKQIATIFASRGVEVEFVG